MRAADLQKVLETLHDTVADSFDHMAGRFEEGVEALGEEYAHLAEFAAGWAKLSKTSRRRFVEQLLKSSALVLASVVATKVGLKIAANHQKQLRKILLGVADLIRPVRKATKKGKKAAWKAKKKLKKAVA